MEERLNILVVDDDELDRMAIRRSIRSAGAPIAITEADSREGAFAILADRSFDCILLDYQLPPSDGLEILRQMRARGIAIPTVVLTGQGDERIAVELMKAGATDYLTKESLTPELLAQSIRAAVRVQRAESQAAEALRESITRLRFMAEASRLLSSSLNIDTLLTELSRLVVPALADWCAIDLVTENRSIERAATYPPASDSAPWVEDVACAWALDPRAAHGAPLAIRGGSPLIYLPADEAAADMASVQPPPPGAAFPTICVPIAIHGRVQGAITLVRREGGRAYAFTDVTLAADLAQRVAVSLDNALLYHQARTAIRLRDDFISIASHEFRTPLTGLLGYVQLLQRYMERNGNTNPREHHAVKAINEQATRLNRMIMSMLDVSRLQRGQLAIQRAPVDLGELVSHVVEEMEPTLERHSISVQIEPPEVVVMGDDLRLHQVIQNLLNNAIKYSPRGGPIEVAVGKEGEEALLRVRDHGIGIPRDALPFLFDRFYRAANADERRISGLGLGLYVVHEVVTLHSGAVQVESSLEEGSTFVVRLPLLQPALSGSAGQAR